MHARKLFAVLTLATAAAMLGAHRDWKTATLVETNRVNDANQAYTFDFGDRTVVCADPSISWVRIKAVPVVVGSQIRYVRVANSALLFLDSKGKEQKCFIQHEALKPTPAP